MTGAFCALVLASCAAQPPKVATPVARHLVIITIDTLRADRLGCYGNRTVATPNIDRLAGEGAMAPDATVHVPLTRPSHISIFTGLYPAEHGIRDNVSPTLSKDVPTLAEILKASGFHTAGFVSSVVLSSQSGLARGFDTYSDRFEVGTDDARFLNTIRKRGDVTTKEAIAWIRAHAGERVFVWLHLYDPHDPYEPPEPYAARYAGRPYDGTVAWSDELVGRVDRTLEELGVRNQTLVVVTSDHGEGLGDHGESVHGFFVYESTLRVPLIFRGPGVVPGLRLGVTARAVDLFPTVLDLIGIQPPADLVRGGDPRVSRRGPRVGRSLAEAIRGRATLAEEPSFAESLLPLLHYGWSDLRTVRDGRWKYILAPRPELYDLRQDPGELVNRVASDATRARALRAGLEQRLKEEQAAGRASPSAASVPPDLLEKLDALGYVGAGGAPEGSPSAGADPKDKIGEYKILNRLVREAMIKLQEKDYSGSVERFRALLARRVESFEVHYYLGRALVGLEHWREAGGHFERAIPRLPAFAPSYLALAECRTEMGDLKGAVAALREGQAAAPTDPRLYEREAETWRRLGGKREAIRAYEAELPLVPKDALVRVRLGELYRDVGDAEKAIRLLRDAVKLDREPASYWNALGMVLGGSGDLSGAESAFREAVTRDGSDPQYAYNLGLALQQQDRSEEAAPYFRQALALNPRFRAARDRLAEMKSR